MGLPTMSLRPSTTARRPATLEAAAAQQLHDPGGRAGHEARPLLHEAAHVVGMEAVHVLPRIHEVEHALGRPPAGAAGSWTRMPWMSGWR